MNKRKILKLSKILGFPLFFFAVLMFGLLNKDALLNIFSSAEKLEAWILERGGVSALIFIGIQIIQVVIFIIPGEIPQIAGGYLFGLVLGALYSSLGILAGSVFNYAMGNWLGRPFVKTILGDKRSEHLLNLVAAKKITAAFFLLFLIPGIPKDALCYIAGISRIGILRFILLSFIGRLPGIIGSAWIGGAAANEKWFLAGTVLTAAVLISLAGFLFRKPLESLIGRWTGRAKGAANEKED